MVKSVKTKPPQPSPVLPSWLTDSELPARLHQAFLAKQHLAEQGIFFAPIRHHSPACAIQVQRYIAQIQPTHVLIEAPHSFEALLPQLLSSAAARLWRYLPKPS